MTDLSKYAYHYTSRLGLALVPIPAGLKGPRENGWNLPENTARTAEEARAAFSRPLNMGVLHSASDTGTLDIDHREWASLALAAVGMDLAALEQWPTRIKGKNGEKPFFQLGGRQYDRHALAWPHPTEKQKDRNGNPTDRPVMVTLFELRAGAVQDVLPPSIHPDTGKPYTWAGTPPRSRDDIPMISPELVHLWENWEELAERMKAACPWTHVLPQPIRAQSRQPSTVPTGERPGDLFSARVPVEEVLLRNGYQRRGERFLPPSSKTKVAGVRILTSDGVRRAFSDHGSCPLNNGHAHTSFSAFTILEHDGDVYAAARAAARELGLPALTSAPTGPDAGQLWAAHASTVCDALMDRLAAATGHARSRQTYMDALLALFASADEGNLHVRGGQAVIEFGGLQALAERMLYRGRLLDLRSVLDYLHTLGMIGRVVSTNPADRYAPLAVEVTADPRDLPALRFPGRLALKSVSYTTRRRKAATSTASTGTERNLDTTKRKLSYAVVSKPLTPLHDARFILYWVRRGVQTVRDLARAARVRPATVRRHLAALESAGLIVDLKPCLSEADSAHLIRLEVESDPAYRAARIRALERTLAFGSRGSALARRHGAPGMAARRHATHSRAHARLARLIAGELCGNVWGVAA